mgnify:CR=1 FL=1
MCTFSKIAANVVDAQLDAAQHAVHARARLLFFAVVVHGRCVGEEEIVCGIAVGDTAKAARAIEIRIAVGPKRDLRRAIVPFNNDGTVDHHRYGNPPPRVLGDG